MTAARIAHALHGKKQKFGPGFVACCPAHDDDNPSLSIGTAPDGQILVYCHAGCAQETVIAALKNLGLWQEPKTEMNQKRSVVAQYNYTDEHGNLLYQIVRYLPKTFKQRYPNGAGGWTWKKYPQQVLYRLAEVLEAPIVFVVEGELDVETLRDYGFVATTNAGGSDAPWLDSYTEALRGREIILIPDNDQPGRQRVLRIARALQGNVAKLVILTLDDPDVKDISNWFSAGHSEFELLSMLDGEEVSQ